jgi:hypothetical protein
MNSLASRRPSRFALALSGFSVPSALVVLLFVLIVHAALVLGEAIEGARWISLLECAAALMIGLRGLRGLASVDESHAAAASFDPVALPMSRLVSASSEAPSAHAAIEPTQGSRS